MNAEAEALFLAVYDELRRLAASHLADEPSGHTLNATALVHESFLRVRQVPSMESKEQYFRASDEAMRRILIDHARKKRTAKRGGQRKRFELFEGDRIEVRDLETMLAVNEAMEKLAQDDASSAEIVRLRLFAGLSVDEAAVALGISRATAFRDWAYARAWLRAALVVE